MKAKIAAIVLYIACFGLLVMQPGIVMEDHAHLHPAETASESGTAEETVVPSEEESPIEETMESPFATETEEPLPTEETVEPTLPDETEERTAESTAEPTEETIPETVKETDPPKPTVPKETKPAETKPQETKPAETVAPPTVPESSSATEQTEAPPSTNAANTETPPASGTGYYFGGADYSDEFDPVYYADHNLDLKAAFGYDATALLQHWVLYGRYENRVAKPGSVPMAAGVTSTNNQIPFSGMTGAGYDPGDSSTVRITAIGDMLMHLNVSNRALQEDGSYNYDYLFENTRDIFLSSDLSVVNNEAIFGGNDRGIKGYPQFNALTQLGDAELSAGFDVSLCATNHSRDQSVSGIRNALAYWNQSPMKAIGINNTLEEKYTVDYVTVKGITIALFNWTYGLNGYKLPAGQEYLVNLMTDAEANYMGAMLREAEENADFSIVFPHWGEEYKLSHNATQERWAKFFIDYGADLIIGTHPHCPEEAEWVTSGNGNVGFCYYSTGNYVSSQGYTYSLIGIVADVTIKKDETGTKLVKTAAIPIVTHYTENQAETFVYKLSEYTDEQATSHGAITFSPQYQTTRAKYPLSLASFQKILNQTGLSRLVE